MSPDIRDRMIFEIKVTFSLCRSLQMIRVGLEAV